jgi:hypothetical protein
MYLVTYFIFVNCGLIILNRKLVPLLKPSEGPFIPKHLNHLSELRYVCEVTISDFDERLFSSVLGYRTFLRISYPKRKYAKLSNSLHNRI